MTLSGGDAHVVHVPSERIFWVLWIVATAWLLACAFLVNGEYGDGYLTIVNARYFFGDAPSYYLTRGPLAAIMLWPAETAVKMFNYGPFEVRPFHIYSAALHSLYLLGCWLALRSTGASPVARILAFATAITTVLFYSFSPYLSHDILPGLFFLLMIFIVNRWLNEGSRLDALLLVIIGTAVVLIKQTFALFWIAIVVYATAAWLLRWDDRRVDWRKLLVLLSLAALSAVLTWLGYAWFMAERWAHIEWYWRPWALIVAVSEIYGRNADMVFPADLYVRNLHNYGILAMILAIPGVIVALRGSNARLRLIAVCWIMSVIVIQLSTFREVRYVLFIAPLTAVLIVPVIEWAVKRRALLIAMVLLVAVDQVRGLTTAARQLTVTATIDPVRFLNSTGTQGRIVASKILSFVYDARGPLQRDSYYGIYHISFQVIYQLLEGKALVRELEETGDLGKVGLRPGDRVYIATGEVRRITPYTDDNSPNMLPDFIQIAGRAAPVTLRRTNEGYVVDGRENTYIMLVPDAEVGKTAPLLSNVAFTASQLETIYSNFQNEDTLNVSGIIIDAICRGDSCQYR